MQVRQFLQRAREIEALQHRYPGVEVRLTGIGVYLPAFSAAQWEQFCGAATPGAIFPGRRLSACGGRSSDRGWTALDNSRFGWETDHLVSDSAYEKPGVSASRLPINPHLIFAPH